MSVGKKSRKWHVCCGVLRQVFTNPWSSSGLPSPLWIQNQSNYRHSTYYPPCLQVRVARLYTNPDRDSHPLARVFARWARHRFEKLSLGLAPRSNDLRMILRLVDFKTPRNTTSFLYGMSTNVFVCLFVCLFFSPATVVRLVFWRACGFRTCLQCLVFWSWRNPALGKVCLVY